VVARPVDGELTPGCPKPPMSRPRSKPKPKLTRAERAAETRSALIEAGLELFGAHGLDAPSLDAICARAGKTRGAFYVHFSDRDAFLEAVMEQAGATYLDAVIGGPDEAADLGAIARRFVASVESGQYPLTRAGGPRPHQLLEACVRSPAVRARYVAIIEQSLARLGAALGEGATRPPGGGPVVPPIRRDLDPRHGATILLATVLGAQTLIELGVPLDVGRTALQLVALVSEPPPQPVARPPSGARRKGAPEPRGARAGAAPPRAGRDRRRSPS